jgi:hypothetical protein
LQACDIFQILAEDSEGKKVAEMFEPGVLKRVAKEERIIIVNKAVGHLVRTMGYYPQSIVKEEMAKKIVKGFPFLGITADGKVEHSHIYCPETGGYIETRLKRLRRALEENQRKRKKNKAPLVRRKRPMRTAKNDQPPFNLEDMKAKVFLLSSA